MIGDPIKGMKQEMDHTFGAADIPRPKPVETMTVPVEDIEQVLYDLKDAASLLRLIETGAIVDRSKLPPGVTLAMVSGIEARLNKSWTALADYTSSTSSSDVDPTHQNPT